MDATGKMKLLREEDNDGRLVAHIANGNSDSPVGCWNCGKSGHMSKECKRPQAKCGKCGRNGHVDKFCDIIKNITSSKSYSGNSGHKVYKANNSGTSAKKFKNSDDKKKAPKSNKAKRRQHQLSKLSAKFTEMVQANASNLLNELLDDEEEEDEELSVVESEYSEEDGFVALTSVEVEEGEDVTAMVTKSKNEINFIIDSACKGAHITNNSKDVLFKVKDSCKATIRGVTGHSLSASLMGELPLIGDSKTYYVPGADANLLCLKNMLKDGGTFSGDFHQMSIFDSNGNLCVKGIDKGDGFWTVSKEAGHSYSAVAYNNDLEDTASLDGATTSQKGDDEEPRVRHYSAEERARAKQAYDLHIRLGHPNDQYLIKALENGNYNHCHLTGQDLRNARELYGKCPACLEAKIRDKPQPISTSPPANEVGEVLHSDLIPLTVKSAGGNTVILFAVDEKSGFKVGVPLKTKQAKDCSQGYEDIVREFNSYGHRVKHIVIDSENTLKASLDSLKSIGIEYSTTPAGLHEKRAEKAIQHIKDLREAMLSVYDYELPAELEAESYLAAIRSANMVPTKASQLYTSHQLVTHHKPTIPEFSFGEIGVARKLNRKSGENRGECVIYLGYNHVTNNHRVYNPITKAV